MHAHTTQRTLKGEVVSTAMNKTLVVRVDRVVVHPKYGKRYVQSKKYHVHDEQNAHTTGEVVKFQASRPYSKTKRWRVMRKESTT
ncbi:30S ribosomal protein S17 [Candidatus Uhrbacteria bacterium]|nr:30S ribosomal protein S17 [Candidatus Uhrbacteria bacterium]